MPVKTTNKKSKNPQKITEMREEVLKAIDENPKNTKPQSQEVAFKKVKVERSVDIDSKKKSSLKNSDLSIKRKKELKAKLEPIIEEPKTKVPLYTKQKVEKIKKPDNIKQIKAEKKIKIQKELKKEDISISKTDFRKNLKLNSISGEKKKTKKSKTNFIFILILLTFLAVVALSVIFLVPKSESDIAKEASALLPFPAIIIGAKTITYDTYLQELDAVTDFLKKQKTQGIITQLPESTETRGMVVNYFIRKEIVNMLAETNGITVSNEEIQKTFDEIRSLSRSDESIDQILINIYGWTQDDFKNRIIRPDIINSKLAKKLFSSLQTEEELKNALSKRIEEIKKELIITVLVK